MHPLFELLRGDPGGQFKKGVTGTSKFMAATDVSPPSKVKSSPVSTIMTTRISVCAYCMKKNLILESVSLNIAFIFKN